MVRKKHHRRCRGDPLVRHHPTPSGSWGPPAPPWQRGDHQVNPFSLSLVCGLPPNWLPSCHSPASHWLSSSSTLEYSAAEKWTRSAVRETAFTHEIRLRWSDLLSLAAWQRGGQHGTEVQFLLLIQLSRVPIPNVNRMISILPCPFNVNV